MDSRDLARLELMLERDVEPVRGFVRETEDCDWRKFSGWLALARELEQALEGDDAKCVVANPEVPPQRALRGARPAS